MKENRCFVTGKPIPEEDMEDARYTESFEAWVSKEGQKILETDPEALTIPELEKVQKEWDSAELDWYEQWKKEQG